MVSWNNLFEELSYLVLSQQIILFLFSCGECLIMLRSIEWKAKDPKLLIQKPSWYLHTDPHSTPVSEWWFSASIYYNPETWEVGFSHAVLHFLWIKSQNAKVEIIYVQQHSGYVVYIVGVMNSALPSALGKEINLTWDNKNQVL